MENYPENIKDAIDWFTEADKEHLTLLREYNHAVAKAFLDIREERKEKDRYSFDASIDVEFKAKLCCKDLCEKADEAAIELTRRKNWLAYLMGLYEGTGKK